MKVSFVEILPVLLVSFLPSRPTVACLLGITLHPLAVSNPVLSGGVQYAKNDEKRTLFICMFLILDEDDKGAYRRANVSFQPATEPVLSKLKARDSVRAEQGVIHYLRFV
jgi:hypothetical protein